jgi:hypothetical protein
VNANQRELLSKYLSDLSKGLLLAGVVGIGTGKLTVVYIVVDMLMALYTIV